MTAPQPHSRPNSDVPQRIQLRRVRGWRKPQGAIVVARPSKWGNPYTISMMRQRIDAIRDALGEVDTDLNPGQMAVEAFRCDLRYGPDSPWWWFGPHQQMIRICGALDELRGHDLACWCPLDQPCHADVLLKIANRAVEDRDTLVLNRIEEK